MELERMQDIVQDIVPENRKSDRRKLLLGLHHYGYDYDTQKKNLNHHNWRNVSQK